MLKKPESDPASSDPASGDTPMTEHTKLVEVVGGEKLEQVIIEYTEVPLPPPPSQPPADSLGNLNDVVHGR